MEVWRRRKKERKYEAKIVCETKDQEGCTVQYAAEWLQQVNNQGFAPRNVY